MQIRARVSALSGQTSRAWPLCSSGAQLKVSAACPSPRTFQRHLGSGQPALQSVGLKAGIPTKCQENPLQEHCEAKLNDVPFALTTEKGKQRIWLRVSVR